jgi:hypothetical protein
VRRAPTQQLRRRWAAVTPETIELGRAWYPSAFAICENIAKRATPRGVGPVRVAGVVAAISPRVRWEENVKMARTACRIAFERDGLDRLEDDLEWVLRGAFPDRRRKAIAILKDRIHPRDLRLGPKCDPFWRAIVGDEDQVVVDAWVARTVGLEPTDLTPARIRTIGRAYRTVAAEVGESPRDLQAILWVHERGSHE